MSFLLITLTSLGATALVLSLASLKFQLSSPFSKLKALNFEKRQAWLDQARVNLTPIQFWLSTWASGFFAFIVAFGISKIFLLGVVIGLSFSAIPYLFIARKRIELSKELMQAWPDALRDISATISSGYTLSFALRTLGQIGGDPIASHMKRFASLEKNLGFSAALEIVRNEMNDSTSDRIIEVLIVANERGGKVVRDIIDDLILSTTQEIALAQTIATESLEMKINSRAVVILPWCVLLLLTISGGIFRTYYQSRAGTFVIFLGIALSIAGMYILNRLSRIQIEPRVFIKDVN